METKRLLQDLIDGLATSERIKKKEAEDFLTHFFDTVEQGLLEDRSVKVNGLGSFKLIEVEARNSVDVNTGQAVIIKEHLKLNFLPEAELRDAINKPFADFEPVEATLETASEVSSETSSNVSSDISSEALSETSQTVGIPIYTTNVSTEPIELIVKPIRENSVVEPEKKPSIQEMLNALNEEEPTMKPKKTPRPTGTLLFVALGIFFLAGLTYWSIVSNKSAQKEMAEKLALLEQYDDTYTDTDTVEIIPATPQTGEVIAAEPKTQQVRNPEPTVQPKTQQAIKPVSTPEAKPSKTTQTTPITETAKSVKSTATKSTIPATVTLGAGDRLTLLAQKYYGHKVFWVYIYLENKEAIANPNNVPVGTTLRMPAKHATMMNANNPEAINKAVETQENILKHLQPAESGQSSK